MNIYHGLLFQRGHIANAELARLLALSEASSTPVLVPQWPRRGRKSRLRWLLEELVLLGGRPVSRGHVDDLEEPLPLLHPQTDGYGMSTGR